MQARRKAPGTGLLGVEPELAERLSDFIGRTGVRLGAGGPAAEVVLRSSAQRRECDLHTLYCGGWIRCGTARALADRLGVAHCELGGLLDEFDIKVKDCALGCF